MSFLTIRFSTIFAFSTAITFALWNVSPAHAAPMVIPNFSFEQDETMGDNCANAAVTGWQGSGDFRFASVSTYDPGQEFNGAKGRGTARKMHGYQTANLWKRCSLQSAESLVTVEAGVTYTLQVAIGDSSLPNSEPGNLQVGFLIGENSPPGSSETFDGNDVTAEGTFDDYTFSYTATQDDAGKTLKIFVRLLDDEGVVAVDNFRLTTGG